MGCCQVLVLGFGNPGRLDDGLGPALVAALESAALPGVCCEANYQLVVEDAAAIAEHEVVVFVDADVGCSPPFCFDAVRPDPTLSFTSHALRPAALLALAHRLPGCKARGYLLGVRGYAFNGFGEGLSAQATANLQSALAFLVETLKARDFAARTRTHARAG